MDQTSANSLASAMRLRADETQLETRGEDIVYVRAPDLLLEEIVCSLGRGRLSGVRVASRAAASLSPEHSKVISTVSVTRTPS
jgi:hypothetical protein